MSELQALYEGQHVSGELDDRIKIDDFTGYTPNEQLRQEAPEWGWPGDFIHIEVLDEESQIGSTAVGQNSSTSYSSAQSTVDSSPTHSQTATFDKYPFADCTIRASVYFENGFGDIAFGVPDVANFNDNCYRIRGGSNEEPFIRSTVNGTSTSHVAFNETLDSSTWYDMAIEFEDLGSTVRVRLTIWEYDDVEDSWSLWGRIEDDSLPNDFAEEGGVAIGVNNADSTSVSVIDNLRFVDELGGTQSPDTQGLVGWWPLNDGSGDTAQDLSGNDNHGTLVNDPEWVRSLIRPTRDVEEPEALRDYPRGAIVEPTAGDADRELTQERAITGMEEPSVGRIQRTEARRVAGYTEPSAGDVDRALAFLRDVTGYTDTSAGTVERTTYLVRDVTGMAQQTVGDVTRAIRTNVRGFVSTIHGDIERKSSLSRAVTGFSRLSRGIIMRDTLFDREILGYAIRTVGDVERTATMFRWPGRLLVQQGLGVLPLGEAPLGESEDIFRYGFFKRVFGTVERDIDLADRVLTGYVQPSVGFVQRSLHRVVNGYVESVVGSTETIVAVWRINGFQIREVIEEIRTWDSLTLTFLVSTSTLKDRIRPIERLAGKYETISRIDGGYDSVDRGGGDAEITVIAPSGRVEVRPVDRFFLVDYTEEPRGTLAEEWDVELEFVPISEKMFDNEFGTISMPPDYTHEPDRWLFEFSAGDILTTRVTEDVSHTPEQSLDKLELELILMEEEVRVLEESAGKVGAVNYREVPDGEDLVTDESTDEVNTVTITPPDTGDVTVVPGDYIIDDFETEFDQGTHVVTLILWEVP